MAKKVKKGQKTSTGKGAASKPKSKKAGKFSSASALFKHLGSAPQRVTLSGAIQSLPADNASVAFTANGENWLALPVNKIEAAKPIGDGSGKDSGLHHVEITLLLPGSTSSVALKSLRDCSFSTFDTVKTAGPTSPPPVCPGGIARWMGDHWECT